MSEATTTQPRSDDFFARIPRSSVTIFLAAVFFTFSPVGLLFASSFRPERPWTALLANAIVSGLLGMSWAAAFTVSRWFIAGIVGFTLGLMALNSVLAATPFGIRSAQPSLEGFGVIAAVVAGYILFIAFISGQGRTTLRLMTEMSLARSIHDTLVPPIRFRGDRVEVIGHSVPSTEMGGDLIDVVEHAGTTDLFLADVSGHGVRAGVVMGMVKSAIRMGLRKRAGLSELLSDLNEVLDGTTSPELYATFAGVRITPAGDVEYALAGHHHIGHYRDGELRRLGERSFPLGLFAGRDYPTATLRLEPGDLLLLYTDGLNETTDAADTELGHDAIEQTLGRLSDRPLEEIRAAILALAEAHGPQNDDRTLLLARAV